MSSKRKSAGSPTNFNFRPQVESKKWETKGTRPLPNPVTVRETLLTMVVQFCRKILFFNTKLRVGLYMAGVFLSFIFDVLPFPKTYFSRTDNLFNRYFVKIGWAWTLLLTLPFVALTCFTYCCGNRKMVLMHLSRLGIATSVWYIFTKMFVYIEGDFGKCSKGKDMYKTKIACLSNDYYWHSLDISGHTFLLIWSTLVIVEEARVINGWEGLKDLIRNESYSRDVNEVDLASPLRKLTDDEYRIMKSSYNKYALYVKMLFVAMTGLTLIWDMMMISTIVYFHIMIEKLIAGMLAAAMWYLTYNYWYLKFKLPPQEPGYGLFKYMKEGSKQKENAARNKSFGNNATGRKPGQTTIFTNNFYAGKQPDKDRMTKDDFFANREQDFERSRQEESTLQTLSPTTGMVTRSHTLKSLKLDGNKTI